MYSLGGGGVPRSRKKALQNRNMVEMHVYNPIFQCQLIKKSITFIVWVLGRVEKNAKKKVKKCKKYLLFCLKQISKCDTCFDIHFSMAFQKYSFQVCSFSHKKVMGYLKFFYTLQTFYRPVFYPMHKKNSQKNPLNYFLLKVKKFHGNSVKN